MNYIASDIVLTCKTNTNRKIVRNGTIALVMKWYDSSCYEMVR